MKLSLSSMYSHHHGFPTFFKSSALIRFCRPFCCSLSLPLSSAPSSVKPQIPLFLRQPIHSTKLCDLKKWHDWAKSVASSIGSSFVNSDNGPDSSILCREIKWLMEDAVEDHSLFSHIGLENNDDNGLRVKIRVNIDELYRLWNQRINERRPFQYIVGCEHWRDLVLSVQEGVLIPRPETELIVDFVSDVIFKNEGLKNGVWADLGTGSGALAIGIGRILGSEGRVVASDLSPVAIAVAGYNIQRYCLQEKIELRQGSWFEPLKDMEGIDGGIDGMDALLHLCDGAVQFLKPGGFFAFETNGEQQCKVLVEYIENKRSGSFHNFEIRSDFAGIQRFVIGFH